MIAEDRAAIVAWQLFGRQAPIEWFKSELERHTTPAWNRALAAIVGAIRDAETEARTLATEAVEWRRQDESEIEFLATWAEEAEALGYFPYICEECGGPALASHAGESGCEVIDFHEGLHYTVQ